MFECVVSTNDKDVTELKVKSSFGRGGEINNIFHYRKDNSSISDIANVSLT